MAHPNPDGVPGAYKTYVTYVKDLDMIEAMKESLRLNLEVIGSIPEEMGGYRYAEGKWSIKEVLNHLMDVERIMAYRALRFARNDKTNLPSFEENDYAAEANAHARTIEQLVEEIKRLRSTTIDLFSSFTPEMLQRTGTANNTTLHVYDLGFVIPGHETHHRKIFVERYLKV